MFKHYLEYSGTEIANTERVAEYVRKNAPQIPLRKRLLNGRLHEALNEAEYESPVVDDAPWVDPSNPATARFYGVVPLSISGGRDSTRQASTSESIGNGGATGAERYASRVMRVKALLVGEDWQAVEAGMTWLDAALRASDCSDHGGSCGGGSLCFYSAEPPVCDEWERVYAAGFTTPLSASVDSSPTLIREPNSEALFKGRLDGPDFPPNTPADGVIVRWGTVSRDLTTDQLEVYGPIVRQRTNLFTRPNFASSDAATWWEGEYTVESGVDGPDFRAYGRTLLDGATYRLVQNTDEPIPSSSGPLEIGVDLRGAADQIVTLTLRDATTDAVLETNDFLIRDEWRRYSMSVPPVASFYVHAESTATFDMTSITIEAGGIAMPHLDGAVPWQSAAGSFVTGKFDPEYVVTWLGTPNASRSRMVWQGEMTVGMPLGEDFETYSGGVCDVWPFIDILQGEFGGGRASFYVRPKIATRLQVLPYERTMHDVRCIEGPLVIEDLNLRTAGAMRTVEFTLVADMPWAYSTPETLIHPTRMSDLPTFEWPGLDDCPVDEFSPIIDPDCPPLPSPPRPPVIAASCVEIPETVQRYWFEIPKEKVSLWSDSVPRITITSGAVDIRQVRVRAFPNPFNRTSDTDEFPVDPCSWCSEFILSYLPPNTELTVDAIVESAYATVAGGASQSAETLLYASDGGPMTWPALSCGIGYIFAIDVPEPLLDDVIISFDLSRRE